MITLDLDDHGYLTAATDEPSPAADRALSLLGFIRPRGQRHQILDVDPGERLDVATDCARLLTAAGYEVAATPALIPDGPPPPTPVGEEALGDPTIAITRHPVLGITATSVASGEGDAHRLITRAGFHYLPTHSTYVLPFDIPHDRALAAATELTRQLAAHHIPAAVSPAIHHPLPGQRLTDHPTDIAPNPADPRSGWATRIAQYLRAVADRLVPAPPSSLPQPVPHTGTAWVQVPLSGPKPRWTPPAALPLAPGVVLRAQGARQSSVFQPTHSPAPTPPPPCARQPLSPVQRRPR
ncbi:hypothetical protein [Streptacidiphilus jiangxiensis]|nr:hypothetical protein [Streptacidiphilus jiangxiensis]